VSKNRVDGSIYFLLRGKVKPGTPAPGFGEAEAGQERRSKEFVKVPSIVVPENVIAAE